MVTMRMPGVWAIAPVNAFTLQREPTMRASSAFALSNAGPPAAIGALVWYSRTVTSREVFQAALALPPEERVELIEELQASLPPLDEEDDAFIDMVNARSAAAEAGAPGTPAEQVFAELLGE